MIGAIIMGIVGIILLLFGYLIWVKEKISLLHEYHYDKISEENKKPFSALSGLGIICIGAGISVTAVSFAITSSIWSFIGFGVGFVIGITLLIYAGRKYNK